MKIPKITMSVTEPQMAAGKLFSLKKILPAVARKIAEHILAKSVLSEQKKTELREAIEASIEWHYAGNYSDQICKMQFRLSFFPKIEEIGKDRENLEHLKVSTAGEIAINKLENKIEIAFAPNPELIEYIESIHAISDLSFSKSVEMRRQAVQTLGAVLESTQNVETRKVVADVLALELLNDPDPEVQAEAARALANLNGCIREERNNRPSFNDPMAVIEAIYSSPNREIFKTVGLALTTALCESEYASLQLAIVESMERLGYQSGWMVKALLSNLEQKAPALKIAIIKALGALSNGQESQEALQKQLQDRMPEVRIAAIHALKEIIKKRMLSKAGTSWIKRSDDPYLEHLAREIDKIKARPIELIRVLAEKDVDPSVRAAAQMALNELSPFGIMRKGSSLSGHN